ncbi:hypothetical protein [Yinghuangia seranimata]|uniref:hypothetical protein n=1 Tax=Yinghuangia seranimata TaxID=408067 RepID=UPI00248B6599|nr:hypothetical protein [Yinghuangia seranimata]MDI2125517.1 hypothetical protein [Yinghuangia seranimata]
MNTTKRRRLALFAPAAAIGLAVPMVLSGVAGASPSTLIRNGPTVAYSAANATANTVAFSTSNGRVIVSDAAGVFAGPGCLRLSATSADCGSTATLTGINATSGDQNDTITLAVPGTPSNVSAGSGNDSVHAKNGVRDQITCGTGFDTVQADTFDVVAADCEVVTH